MIKTIAPGIAACFEAVILKERLLHSLMMLTSLFFLQAIQKLIGFLFCCTHEGIDIHITRG